MIPRLQSESMPAWPWLRCCATLMVGPFQFRDRCNLLTNQPVKDAVKLIIGKVIQSEHPALSYAAPPNSSLAYLELAEMTELETLNSTMDTFVALYAEELLPVATQLTTRLVR
jgi:hypothetical protein